MIQKGVMIHNVIYPLTMVPQKMADNAPTQGK